MKYLTMFFLGYSVFLFGTSLYSGSYMWALLMGICAYFNYQSLKQYR